MRVAWIVLVGVMSIGIVYAVATANIAVAPASSSTPTLQQVLTAGNQFSSLINGSGNFTTTGEVVTNSLTIGKKNAVAGQASITYNTTNLFGVDYPTITPLSGDQFPIGLQNGGIFLQSAWSDGLAGYFEPQLYFISYDGAYQSQIVQSDSDGSLSITSPGYIQFTAGSIIRFNQPPQMYGFGKDKIPYTIDVSGTYGESTALKFNGTTLNVSAQTLTNTLHIVNNRTIATATTACQKGEITYNSTYVFVCIGTNTWRRAALSSW